MHEDEKKKETGSRLDLFSPITSSFLPFVARAREHDINCAEDAFVQRRRSQTREEEETTGN